MSSLFGSDTKFDLGTKWPSFCTPVKEDSVKEEVDANYGRERTEVTCGECGAHLGNVFDDGSNPTGLCYCINLLSLSLAKGATDER